MRGNGLENYNVLDFYVETYEEDISNEWQPNPMREILEDNIQERSGSNVICMGCPRNQRMRYQEVHPKVNDRQYIKHSKGHCNLPNFIGSHLPQNNDPKVYDFYCASILLLLKPW